MHARSPRATGLPSRVENAPVTAHQVQAISEPGTGTAGHPRVLARSPRCARHPVGHVTAPGPPDTAVPSRIRLALALRDSTVHPVDSPARPTHATLRAALRPASWRLHDFPLRFHDEHRTERSGECRAARVRRPVHLARGHRGRPRDAVGEGPQHDVARHAAERSALREAARRRAAHRRGDGPHRDARDPRPHDLQLLAGPHARARHPASHDAGELSEREPRMGDRARRRHALGTRGRELGVARHELPPSRGAALSRRAVERRQGCRRDARVRRRDEAVRRRRLPAPRVEGGRDVGGREHAARLARLRARHAHQVGLSVRREAPRARQADRSGGGGVPRRARPRVGQRVRAARRRRPAAGGAREPEHHLLRGRDLAAARRRPRGAAPLPEAQRHPRSRRRPARLHHRDRVERVRDRRPARVRPRRPEARSGQREADARPPSRCARIDRGGDRRRATRSW